MKAHRFSNSLQLRIPMQLVVMLLPLMVLLIFFNIYSTQLVQEQTASLVKNTISLLESQISATLSQIDRSLLSMDINSLSTGNGSLSSADAQTILQMRARNSIRPVLGTYSFLDGVFLYSPDTERVNSYSHEYGDLSQKLEILDEIKKLSERFSEGEVTSWTGVQLNGEFYLVRILSLGEYHIGAWLQPRRLFSHVWTSEVQALDHIGFVTDSGQTLFAGFPDFSSQFSKTRSASGFGRYYAEDVAYNTISLPLRNSALSIVALVQTSSILRGLPILQDIFLLVTAVLFLVTIFLSFRINARIVRPAMRIVGAMQELGKGDFSARIHEKNVYNEFQQIGMTFNQMAAEIGQLKIAVYEGKLREQRTELQFLQLQLKPHFFINTLNVIYSLAEVSDFETIRNMVQALTRYFRYALKKHDKTVLLCDEIRHVQNYAEIQKMRYRNRLQVCIESDAALGSCHVPLFVLQTFVENSMKYAFLGDNTVCVNISVCLDTDPHYLNIDIQDNGPGYPPEMLGENADQTNGGARIGIENLRSRLALLFKGEASLTLSNPPEGGAHALIRLPYETGGNDVQSSLG